MKDLIEKLDEGRSSNAGGVRLVHKLADVYRGLDELSSDLQDEGADKKAVAELDRHIKTLRTTSSKLVSLFAKLDRD